MTPKTLWNLVTLINSVAAENNAILNSRNYFKFLPIRVAEQRDRALKWIAVRLPQFAADGLRVPFSTLQKNVANIGGGELLRLNARIIEAKRGNIKSGSIGIINITEIRTRHCRVPTQNNIVGKRHCRVLYHV